MGEKVAKTKLNRAKRSRGSGVEEKKRQKASKARPSRDEVRRLMENASGVNGFNVEAAATLAFALAP